MEFLKSAGGLAHVHGIAPLPAFAILSGLCGCVPKVDDDLSLVSTPRLLAVQSTPAEAAQGAPVMLQALVASADGSLTPTVTWYGCNERKPLTELGPVSPVCLDPSLDAGASPLIGAGNVVSWRVPANASQLFGPTLPPPIQGQPSGRPADPDPTGGYYQPYVATLGGKSESLGSLRLLCDPPGGTPRDQLILFNQQYVANANPSIYSLTTADSLSATIVVPESLGASALAVVPSQKLNFRVTWSACPRSSSCRDGLCSLRETPESCAADCQSPQRCTGAESYVALNDDKHLVERRESIFVSWYATHGTFENRRTGVAEADPDVAGSENTWIAPATPAQVYLWLVIRDDRGGVGWKTYQLVVQT